MPERRRAPHHNRTEYSFFQEEQMKILLLLENLQKKFLSIKEKRETDIEELKDILNDVLKKEDNKGREKMLKQEIIEDTKAMQKIRSHVAELLEEAYSLDQEDRRWKEYVRNNFNTFFEE